MNHDIGAGGLNLGCLIWDCLCRKGEVDFSLWYKKHAGIILYHQTETTCWNVRVFVTLS